MESQLHSQLLVFLFDITCQLPDDLLGGLWQGGMACALGAKSRTILNVRGLHAMSSADACLPHFCAAIRAAICLALYF